MLRPNLNKHTPKILEIYLYSGNNSLENYYSSTALSFKVFKSQQSLANPAAVAKLLLEKGPK